MRYGLIIMHNKFKIKYAVKEVLKMTANYHTHTFRCRHAAGSMGDYALEAQKQGIKILGFSDHVPCEFPNGYVSSYRMPVSETQDYVRDVRALREKFKGKLEILIGYECEYYPELFGRVLSNIKRYGCDYLILGQHFTNNEYDGVYSGSPTSDVRVLKGYTDRVTEGIRTQKFSCVAHPDLINFRGDGAVYRREMKRLCQAAKDCKVPLELNLLGLKENRHYPREEFWQIAAQVGNEAILGVDAHCPEAFDAKVFKRGGEYLSRFGIKPIETLKLKTV